MYLEKSNKMANVKSSKEIYTKENWIEDYNKFADQFGFKLDTSNNVSGNGPVTLNKENANIVTNYSGDPEDTWNWIITLGQFDDKMFASIDEVVVYLMINM